MTVPLRAPLGLAAGSMLLLLAAAGVAPRASGADEARDATDGNAAPQAAPPTAEASEPPPSPTELVVDWDDGPRYRLVQRLSGLSERDRLELLRDVRLEGRIGGSLYLDGGVIGGSALDNAWEGEVRRFRVETHGSFSYFLHTEYKVEVALEKNRIYLNDFYLRWRPERWLDTVKVGYFDPPMSLEALASSSDRSFLEVAAPLGSFAPGMRLGIEATGSARWPSISWGLALSSVGQTQPFADASSSAGRVTGRLVWRPGYDDAAPDAPLLHLGLSLSGTFDAGGDLRYRARPESFLAPVLVDTGELDGNAGMLALEGAYRAGPLTLIAEVMDVVVGRGSDHTRDFVGAYAQASWALTGEVRPYDRENAVFLRLVPRASFAPWRADGGLGAIEMSGRIAWIDLTDGPVRGGRMLTIDVGPTWTWNAWVRLLMGYVYAHVTDRPDAGDAHIGQMRVELRF